MTGANLPTLLPPVIERRARGVEMHFASLTLVRTSAGGPPIKMKPFRRRCQALAAAPGRALLSRRRLSGCPGPSRFPIPWNPIQGFIPLPLLAGSLVSPSPLPSLSGETDTQLERLVGHSLAVDLGGRDYSLFTMTQECGIRKNVARFRYGGVVSHLELKNALQPRAQVRQAFY